MAASLFNGNAIRILRNILRFKDGTEISSTQAGYLNTITSDVQTQLDAKVDESREGQNNGIATLDAGGKVPVAQLPNSIMDYLGTWAASTNTPTLANGSGSAGDVYIAADAGTVNFGAGGITFAAGDWVVYSGSVWQKSINSNAVASVNSQTGAVVLTTSDIAEGTNLYFTNAAAQAAITGGASSIVTANLATSVALASDGSGKVVATSVTAAELGHVSGVTSAIQTQLNGKEPSITTLSVAKGGTNSGAALNNNRVMQSSGSAIVEAAAITATRALISDANGIPTASATTSTELGHVSGVTSAIQTQLDAKQLRSTLTAKGDLYVATASNTVARQAVGTDGTFLKADSGVTNGVVWASANSTYAIRSISSTDTLNAISDDVALLSGASFTLNLPTAVGITGKRFIVKHKGTSGSQLYTIDPNGAETIEGAANYIMYVNLESVTFVSNGAGWDILEKYVPAVVMQAYKNGGSVSANTTIPTWTSIVKDSVGSFNSTTGVYTVIVPGDYHITHHHRLTATNGGAAIIALNGTQTLFGAQPTTSDGKYVAGLLTGLVAGDTITVQQGGASTLVSTNISNVLNISLVK